VLLFVKYTSGNDKHTVNYSKLYWHLYPGL